MLFRSFIVASIIFVSQTSDLAAKVLFPEFEKAAHSYSERLQRQGRSASTDISTEIVEAQRAEESTRWASAIAHYEAAAGASGTPAIWIRLAWAWQNFKPEARESVWAAYNAYALTRSKAEEAETLRVLADQIYRQYAVDASELQRLQKELKTRGPASLERLMDEHRKVTAEALLWLHLTKRAYSQLRIILGTDDKTIEARANKTLPEIFEPVGKYVNITDKSAVYCVRFSLPLKSEASIYLPFVALTKGKFNAGTAAVRAATPMSPELKVSDNELCLYGLEHGQNYTLHLRASLPSQGSHVLSGASTIEFRVPDRRTQVQFRAAAYVLPKYSDGIIPMKTINASSATMDFIRLSDRNFIREIVVRKLGARLRGGLDDLVTKLSEPMWTGRAVIRSPRPNVEETTHLPVIELLKARRKKTASIGRQSGGRVALSLGSFTGELLADSKKWERLANKAPSPGVYGLIVRHLEDAPTKPDAIRVLRNWQQPNEDSDGIPTLETKERPSWDENGAPVQWFVVTDIGLTYYEGRSRLYVMARSLKTGLPLENCAIQLVTANNRVIAEKKTNDDGVAEFPVTLAQGTKSNRLAAIFAASSDDFSFVDFSRDFFDMSNRGAEGRLPAKHLDAFVYTERGIYRPGENIIATVIVRDAQGRMAEMMPPLNIVMRSAGGMPIGETKTITEWSSGGALVRGITIPQNAPLGALKVEVHLGSDGKPVGSATVQVEHFKPDRARIAFVPEQWQIEQEGTKASISGKAEVQYLYGVDADAPSWRDAPVQGARGEVELLLRRSVTPVYGCYNGFSFGRTDERFIPAFWRKPIEQASDQSGHLNLGLEFDGVPRVNLPLEMTVTVSAFDRNGILARRSEKMIMPRRTPLLGIRLATSPNLATGEVEFEFLALDGKNRPRFGKTLRVQLMAERDDFIYVNTDDTFRPSPQIGRRAIGDEMLVKTGPEESEPAQNEESGETCYRPNAREKFKLEPGRYFLSAVDDTGARSSLRFTVGYSSSTSSEPTPDKANIIISSDRRSGKPGSYRTNDTLSFTVEAPFDGPVMIAISDGDIVRWLKGSTNARRAVVRTDIPADWAGKALYAVATVFRPGGEGADHPAPARALGAAYFDVDREKQRLEVKFDGEPYMLSPDRSDEAPPFKVNLTVDGEDEGAFAIILAVDEGILNLTRHEEADPYGYFFGRRALGLGILDSYGRILQKGTAVDRSGGDLLPPERLTFQNYVSHKNLIRAFGPVRVINGTASVDLTPKDLRYGEHGDDGAFDGTLRLVALVWSRTGVGAAKASAVVRSAVVVDLGVPRFLGSGDTAILPLTLSNVQGQPGEYEIELSAGAPLRIVGVRGANDVKGSKDTKTFRTSLNEDERLTLDVAVSSPLDSVDERYGLLKVDLKGAEPSNSTGTISRIWRLNLRPPLAPTTRLMSFKVAPGASQRIDAMMLEDMRKSLYVPHTFQVVARVARTAGPAASFASDFIRDLPPVSLDALVAAGNLLLGDAASPTTQGGLRRIANEMLALQNNEGGFLSYRETRDKSNNLFDEQDTEQSGFKTASLLQNAAAVDLLGKITKMGISTAVNGYEAGLNNLYGSLQEFVRGQVGYYPHDEDCAGGYIYSALVLAQNNRIEDSDVKAIVKRCSKASLPVREKAMLAEMLRSFGADDSARLVMANLSNNAFEAGAAIDFAEAWAHLVAAKAPREVTDKLHAKLVGVGNTGPELSLKALGWLARGTYVATQPEGKDNLQVSFSRDVVRSRTASSVSTGVLSWNEIRQGVEIRNDGRRSVTVTLALRGQAKDTLLSPEGGFTIRRRLFRANGEELTGEKVSLVHNELLYVVLEGLVLKDYKLGAKKTESPYLSDAIVVIDTLPAGFEIVQTNIFGQNANEQYLREQQMLDLEGQGRISSVEARDDHWLSILRAQKTNEQAAVPAYRTGYAVRATLRGTFAVPPAVAEDYKAPEISGISVGTRALTVKEAE